MDYQTIYNNLISKRQKEPALGYTENHHIVMKSMGGSDDLTNLVKLTGREHYVAHLLLWKIHKNQQTIYACHMMAMRCEERGIPRIKTSRTYEYVRKQHAKYMSEKMKKIPSYKTSQYGTMWICNIDKKENRKIKNTDCIPKGWIKGRNKWKNKNHKPKNRIRISNPFFINNGKKSKYVKYEDQLPIPDDWVIGKLPANIDPKVEALRRKKISNHMKGPSNPAKSNDWMWITDGKVNKKLSKNKAIPNGFHHGMTFK